MSEPHSSNPFDDAVTQYDAWFDSGSGRTLFEEEMDCLRRLVSPATGRWTEVGVGTGRFAVALGVSEGVDPSAPMRALAEGRGVRTSDGAGECLPYADGTFDGVLMTTAVCFLADTEKAFEECRRVLKGEGRLVVGLIPADSSWGRLYTHKAVEGHPIYSAATFLTAREVVGLAGGAGFELQEAWSCLLTPPESFSGAGHPQEGIVPEAGFVAMAFSKAGPTTERLQEV